MNKPLSHRPRSTDRLGLVLCSSLLVFAACSCGNNGSYTPGRSSPVKEAPAATVNPAQTPESRAEKPGDEAKNAPQTGEVEQHRRENFDEVFAFADNLHRAHLWSGGLLVDFGTPARFANTLADWRTGWRGNFTSDGVTFSYAEDTGARFYFDTDADRKEPAKIVVRARNLTGFKVGVYLDKKPLGKVEFSKDEFGHATIDVPSGLEAGMHEVMLRSKARRRAHDGKPACLAVDYVRVLYGEEDTGQASASYETLLVPDGKGKHPGIVLTAGEALSFHVPLGDELSLQGHQRPRTKGLSAFEVSLTVDGREPEVVYSSDAVGQSGGNFGVDLSKWAGETAILTLRATSGEGVFTETGLYAPKLKPEKNKGGAAGKARNVVVVLIDTLRADKLSAYDPATRVRTPYLDRLAEESMVFERALAPENWTKPSVASVLSGLYPTTHAAKDGKDKLPGSVTMISEHLENLGFATAGFVANGYVSDKFGFKQGWDTWTNYVREGKSNRAKYVFQDAIEWLENRAEDKPFFLYIQTIDPHVPYIPPRKYLKMYDSAPYDGPVRSSKTAAQLGEFKTGKIKFDQRDRARLEALYDGEISYHDDQFARLHEKLAELELLEDTVIVVTSDHGEEFFEHGSVGHGHSLYEELLHVPLIIKAPKGSSMKAGRWPGEVSLVDIVPTVCDLTGNEPPQGTEGRSLVPMLEARAQFREPSAAFAEFLSGQLSVRFGRYKAIYKGLSPELYDLLEDPEESRNLSKKRPIALAAARDLLGHYLGRFVETEQVEPQKGKSPKKSPKKRHKAEKTNIDPETREQLKALGYIEE